MKVLILSNGELQEQEIENTLEALQKIVGGYIEMPLISKKFFYADIDVIINEEGKYIEGLKPEIAVASRNGTVLDLVMGNCIFASHNEEGETVGLNQEQIGIVKKALETEVVLSDTKNNKTTIVKALFV